VTEPSVERDGADLNGLKSRFEEHHEVKYTRQAFAPRGGAGGRYINDRHMPDKAIDVIDEAGASQRLQPPSRRKRTIAPERSSRWWPRWRVSRPRRSPLRIAESLKNLERDLKLMIYGQDAAIVVLAAAIKMARSGLGQEERRSARSSLPVHGRRKTEVTRQLAKIMGIELIRFDMS